MMTLVELNAKKAELIQSILNDVDSEEILEELNDLLICRVASKKYPYKYTIEEMRFGIQEAIQEYKEGKGTPHEEMKKRFSL